MNFLVIAIFAGDSGGKNLLTQVTLGLYIWTIITFLLLFYVLAKFAWKPLLKMLEERENLIKSSLDDAEKARQELEKIKDDTIAKAKDEASKIREDAKHQIQVEKDKAITDIKKEVVDLSISVAEKLINKNISEQDNSSLIEESLKKIKKYEA